MTLTPVLSIISVMALVIFANLPQLFGVILSGEWRAFALALGLTAGGAALALSREHLRVPFLGTLGVFFAGIGAILLIMSVFLLFSG